MPDGVAAKRGKCPACGRVFSLRGGDGPRVRATLRGHAGPVQCVAFSPDGKLLATGCAAGDDRAGDKRAFGEIKVWQAAGGQPVSTLRGHRDGVLSLAFSPTGETLVTGSQDQTLGVWDVSRGLWDAVMGIRVHTLRVQTGAVTCVAFHRDGTLLASGSDDRAVRLWSTESWQMQTTINTGRKGACHLAFSPDGKTLAAVWSSRGPAILWDMASRQEWGKLRLRTEEDFEDYALAFSPDGSKLAVLSADDVRLWDLSTCQVLVAFKAGGIKSLAFSPDGKTLATVGWEVSTHVAVCLREPGTGREIRRLQGHNLPVTALAFSPDGRILATGSRDATVNLWDLSEDT